jgi:hypothetical protein
MSDQCLLSSHTDTSWMSLTARAAQDVDEMRWTASNSGAYNTTGTAIYYIQGVQKITYPFKKNITKKEK